MLLFGHSLIKTKPFYQINRCENIEKTPSNAIVVSHFDAYTADYCTKNGVVFALYVNDIRELILASNLKASFFVVKKSFAIVAQNIANEYLFDGKILLLSDSENDIDFAAMEGIDGILFTSGIKAPL